MPSRVFSKKKLIERLQGCVESSRTVYKDALTRRRESIEQYAGTYYMHLGWDAGSDYVNPLAKAVDVLLDKLASGDPKAHVVAESPADRPAAYAQSLVLSKWSKEIGFGAKMREVATDALFMIGCCHNTWDEVAETEIDGEVVPILEPNFTRISPSAMVFDLTANSFDTQQFYGHFYTMRLEDARERFSNLKASDIAITDTASDEEGNTESASENSGASTGKRLYDHVEFLQIFLPNEGPGGVVVTLDYKNWEVVDEYEWEWGGKYGPYGFLRLGGDVPDNVLPKPIVADLVDLAVVCQASVDKMVRQFLSEKSLVLSPNTQTGEDDATQVMNSPDNGYVKVNDPSKLVNARFHGVTGSTASASREFLNLFSTGTGYNFDMLAGEKTNESTLGQSEILASATSGRMKALLNRAIVFISDRFEFAMGRFLDDPLFMQTISIEKPEVGIELDFEVDGEQVKMSGHGQYNVVPYSNQYRPPQQRLGDLIQLMNFIMPLMPMLAEQGYSIDAKALVETVSCLSDTPELRMVLRVPPDKGGTQRDDGMSRLQSPEAPGAMAPDAGGGGGGGGAMPEQFQGAELQEQVEPWG